jgi:hypothetical protein
VTYIRDLAEQIRDNLDPALLPEGDTSLLFDLYALVGTIRGQETSSSDVHDAWVIWMMSRSEVHEAMVPYENLPQETQEKDEPYAEAIRLAVGKRQT